MSCKIAAVFGCKSQFAYSYQRGGGGGGGGGVSLNLHILITGANSQTVERSIH